ncbi:hypothetical protein DPMN_148245 [Dreissena polymorpha]|uniref:Uncharacterized protein n=1 Tax=Dreissena polymorpha TaxID=45954 RepID=A0A9D4J456_DREPO|nr:hypothetical protein DPMN_148245 [Dreissena polymorpha]
MFLLPIRTIFKLNRHIQKTHVLTKFHEDWTKNVTSRIENCPAPWRPCFFTDLDHFRTRPTYHDWAKILTSRVFTRNTAPPPGGHVFQRTGTIFALNQHIIKTNILTKLHEDWASNVTSTVFELNRGINRTNILTKFHEDQTINVASVVFTRQMLTPHDAQRTTDDGKKAITKAHHEHVVLR